MAIDTFRGKHRFLSNFYKCPVRLDDITWPTAEHAYQAAKTFNKDEKTALQLCSSPGAVKKLGRGVTLRSDWGKIKVRVMLEVLRAKFSQNVEVQKLLTGTGTEDLIEGNTWNDTYWGVCDGAGENILGKLLMLVRAEFFNTRLGIR